MGNLPDIEDRYDHDEREDDIDPDDPDAEGGYCPACSGSGEGQYDGSSCRTCGGSGEQK